MTCPTCSKEYDNQYDCIGLNSLDEALDVKLHDTTTGRDFSISIMTAIVVRCFKESTLEHSSHHNRLVRLCWLLTSSFSLSVPSVRFTHAHARTLQQLLLSTFTAIQTARNVPL